MAKIYKGWLEPPFDRYNCLVVTLEKDMRDDDAEWIINAIRMIRGVNLLVCAELEPAGTKWRLGSKTRCGIG